MSQIVDDYREIIIKKCVGEGEKQLTNDFVAC